MKKLTVLLTSILTFATLSLASVQANNYTSKDLIIVHRPIAAVQPPAPATNGLKVSAWVNRSNNTYRAGDELQLYVRSNKDVYITVIDVGTSGKVHQVFPNAYERSHLIKAHINTPIPGKKTPYFFKVAGPVGNQLLKIIASESPDPIVPSQYTSKSGPFPQLTRGIARVAKDLEITLREPQHRARTVVYNKVIHIR